MGKRLNSHEAKSCEKWLEIRIICVGKRKEKEECAEPWKENHEQRGGAETNEPEKKKHKKKKKCFTYEDHGGHGRGAVGMPGDHGPVYAGV